MVLYFILANYINLFKLNCIFFRHEKSKCMFVTFSILLQREENRNFGRDPFCIEKYQTYL